MPREPRRRPAPPRPQTARCRFSDSAGNRCRSIATVDGFCHPHVRALEADMAQQNPIENLIGGLFGVRRVDTRQISQQMAEAGAAFVTGQLRQRFPGMMGLPGHPVVPIPGQSPGAGPRPPRQRVSPEAIARRKANLAARGAMGFGPDEALTEKGIRDRRRDLARVYHTDNAPGQRDETREAMMRKINEAAELLLEAARGAAPPR